MTAKDKLTDLNKKFKCPQCKKYIPITDFNSLPNTCPHCDNPFYTDEWINENLSPATKELIEGKKTQTHKKKQGSTPSTSPISSTSSTSPTNVRNIKIKEALSTEIKPYKSIGQGIHNNIYYFGNIIEYDGKIYDVIVTSERKIYVNWNNDKNEIRDDFGLNYRFPFFYDCLDHWMSHEVINGWINGGVKANIRAIYDQVREHNKQYVIYEDERIHSFVAVDIIKTYFFRLFPANGRTFNQADPGSGKTNQISVYRALSFNPITSPDFSSSSIYRNIESTSATILFDDFDDLTDEEDIKVRKHIRVNYKPFKTLRSDGKGFRPRGYNAYSHFVFNTVEGLPTNDRTTPERCIGLPLLKYPQANVPTVDHEARFWDHLRDDLYIIGLQYHKEVMDAYNNINPKEIGSRDLEIIRGNLAIARVIGDDVYKEIFEWNLERLEQEKFKDCENDWEYQLLKLIGEKIKDQGDDWYFVNDFTSDLIELVDISYNSDNPDNDLYDPARAKKQERRYSSYIGKKLKNYPVFKAGAMDGRSRYFLTRDEWIKLVKSKTYGENLVELVGLVEPKGGIDEYF